MPQIFKHPNLLNKKQHLIPSHILFSYLISVDEDGGVVGFGKQKWSEWITKRKLRYHGPSKEESIWYFIWPVPMFSNKSQDGNSKDFNGHSYEWNINT